MRRYEFNTGWTCNGNEVTLPHDAMIEGERSADAPGGSAVGFFHGGKYTYEKKFFLPKEWSGMPIKLQFEGVYKNAKVIVNGTLLGGCVYGYLPFWIDCGILPAGMNEITVICDNEQQPDSRWYSGAGIYRPVWIWVGEGLTNEDVRISTLSYNPAKIQIEILKKDVAKSIEIYDGEKLVASGEGIKQVLEIPDARLWNEENPYLYTCKVDDIAISFGIRQIDWKSGGLKINGKETLLRGGCVHHDQGILGAATYDESEWRRVRILKEAGYNAIRSSHNPCSRAMLEACDYYGMYLIDESWDMWFHHKSPFDYASDWEKYYCDDLKAMAARDYNHPSVIAYSIGNEVSEPAKEEGIAATREMVSVLHEADRTRPVTGGFNLMIIANSKKGKGIYDEENGGRKNDDDKKMSGMNSTMFNFIASVVGTGMNKAANSKKADRAVSPCLDALDMAGYNYASGRYTIDQKKHPERMIYGSETFPQDIAKNWKMVQSIPNLIGDFMWTSWDYLGEAGLGAWAYTSDAKGFNKPYPWLLADAGAHDILGNPNGEAFHAAAVWDQLKRPAIAVRPVNHPGETPAKGVWRGTNAIPSWSWKGCEGNTAWIEVYFKGYQAELFVNDRSIGKKKLKDGKAIFKTKYEPGTLHVIAYDRQGRVLGENSLESAKEARIFIQPEKQKVKSGEIVYVPIRVGDGTQAESSADRLIEVKVDNGELLAFGSANPRTEERYQTGCFTTYYGESMAVVRAGNAGIMMVKAGDAEAEIIIS